jgi:transcriptional regulator with XRE-family HTH domain
MPGVVNKVRTNVGDLREARGWTQAQVITRLINVARSRGHVVAERASLERMLSRWENGHPIGSRYRALLAVVFDCTPDELGAGFPEKARDRDLSSRDFISWLAGHSDMAFEQLYEAVCVEIERLEQEPSSARHARAHERGLVSRSNIADAVRAYYGASEAWFQVRFGGGELRSSMVTRSEWLDVAVSLGGDDEIVSFGAPSSDRIHLGPLEVDAAIRRLAATELAGTVLYESPLYRLLDVDLRRGRLAGALTSVAFSEHALTTELMEGELLDAIAVGSDRLPLRDRYLPSLASVWDLAGRRCVGGPVTLLAVARGSERGAPDYMLFTQKRSPTVLNLAGSLAVLPKGFHQPMREPAREARLSTTIEREFEEELLGRADLEQIVSTARRPADPLHESQVTEPLAWLHDRPGTHRVECTGLGFNALTSNYEFACLIVVHDEEWWRRFGHLVVANWESDGLYRHSSLDTSGLARLVFDPRWGNESLFSLVQGLRRLREVGDPHRLAIPPIDLTMG